MKRIATLAAITFMIASTATAANADRYHDDHDHGHRHRRGNNTSVALRIGRVGISVGSPGYSNIRFGNSRYNNRGFGYDRNGVGLSFGQRSVGYGRSYSTWHDTSRYDYRRPVRYGNHYDYIPRRYGCERSGY